MSRFIYDASNKTFGQRLKTVLLQNRRRLIITTLLILFIILSGYGAVKAFDTFYYGGDEYKIAKAMADQDENVLRKKQELTDIYKAAGIELTDEDFIIYKTGDKSLDGTKDKYDIDVSTDRKDEMRDKNNEIYNEIIDDGVIDSIIEKNNENGGDVDQDGSPWNGQNGQDSGGNGSGDSNDGSGESGGSGGNNQQGGNNGSNGQGDNNGEGRNSDGNGSSGGNSQGDGNGDQPGSDGNGQDNNGSNSGEGNNGNSGNNNGVDNNGGDGNGNSGGSSSGNNSDDGNNGGSSGGGNQGGDNNGSNGENGSDNKDNQSDGKIKTAAVETEIVNFINNQTSLISEFIDRSSGLTDEELYGTDEDFRSLLGYIRTGVPSGDTRYDNLPDWSYEQVSESLYDHVFTDVLLLGDTSPFNYRDFYRHDGNQLKSCLKNEYYKLKFDSIQLITVYNVKEYNWNGEKVNSHYAIHANGRIIYTLPDFTLLDIE